MNWNLFDFMIAFLMLSLLYLGVCGILKGVKTPWKRRISLLIVLIIFVLILGELALGLFGSPFAGS
jgi:choline-glycine betaine transporter